jgi:regulator of nucleoside diphosphate kinase
MNIVNSRPPILISDVDKNQLYKIARGAAKKFEDIADELMTELERAEKCPAGQLPPNVVRMQSKVQFVTDKGTEHNVELVYPEDADIIRDRLSILSPIGTALIGLSEGQVMFWIDRAGGNRWLKVLEVNQPYVE